MNANAQYVTDKVDCDWWDIRVEFKGGAVVKADSHHDFHAAWEAAGRPQYVQRASSEGVPCRCHPVVWSEDYHDALIMSGFFGTPVKPDQGFTFASAEALRTAAKGLRRAGMAITKDKLGWCFRPKHVPGAGRIVPEVPHKILVTEPKAPLLDEAPPW